jgi:hypothetical protein
MSKFLYDGMLFQADDDDVSDESMPLSFNGNQYAEASSTPIKVGPLADIGTQVEESGGSTVELPLPSQMSISDSNYILVGSILAPLTAPAVETPAAASRALTMRNASSQVICAMSRCAAAVSLEANVGD